MDIYSDPEFEEALGAFVEKVKNRESALPLSFTDHPVFQWAK